MANLTLRSTTSATTPSGTTAKASALTHVEMDSNFILLNDEKLDAANGTATGTLTLANNGILQLNEASSNGTNYVQIKTPAALSGNYVLTLPPNDGNANRMGNHGEFETFRTFGGEPVLEEVGEHSHAERDEHVGEESELRKPDVSALRAHLVGVLGLLDGRTHSSELV